MNRRTLALGLLASAITLSSCGSSATAHTAPTVATVSVSPPSQSLGIQQTAQLTATVKDAQGNVLSGHAIDWSSSQPATASVSSSGLVTALAAGTTTITATVENQSGTAQITVSAPVSTVSVSAPSTTLIPQQTVQLAVLVKSADGATISGRAVSYLSSAQPVATVSATGLVTAVAVGTTTITASTDGKSGTIALTVTTGTVVGPTGGTVTGGNGAVVLTIPAGALATNTPITIVPVAGVPTGAPAGVRFNGTTYQIGTPGLTFAQPVTIKLKYDAATLPLWVMSGDMVILGGADAGWTALNGIIVDTVAQTVSGTTTAIGRAGGAPGSAVMPFALGRSAPLPSLTWGHGVFATALLSAGTPPTVSIAVNPVTVTLTPANDSVNTQKRSVMFHASLVPVGNPVTVPVPGVTSPKPLWRYRWRTTGQNGTLSGGTTDTDWMDSPDIQYICTNANLSVVSGKMDDVILDVLLNPGTETDPPNQQIVRVQGSVFAGLKKTFEISPDDQTIGPGASQQLKFIVRDQAGTILPTDPNTRFTWKNSAYAGDLQNGSTPDIVTYQAKSTFTSPPPRVDQVDGQIDGVTTVVERSTHWDFSNLIRPVLVVDRTQNVTYTLQGTAKTFVTVHVDYTVTLQPANPTVVLGGNQALSVVLTPAYNGTGLAYVWSSPGTHGTLTETNGNHSANKQATYTAKQLDPGGTDQISVKVVSYLAGVELETLGTGTASVVVDASRTASFSARQIPINGGVSWFTSATLEIPKVAGATSYQVTGMVLGAPYTKTFSGATSTNTQSIGQVLDGGTVFYINLDGGFNTIKTAADARLANYLNQYAGSAAKYKALP